jgi:hypothetical protein
MKVQLQDYNGHIFISLEFVTIVMITEVVNKDSSDDSTTTSTQTMMDSL